MRILPCACGSSLLLTLAFSALPQAPDCGRKCSAATAPELPSIDLAFETRDISVATPSDFPQGWPVCGEDGTVLIHYIQDNGLEHGETMSPLPHGTGMSLSRSGTTTLFPYDRIRGLYLSQVRDMDLDDDEVVFHLWAATAQDEQDHSTLNTVPSEQGPAKAGASKHFAAFFKRNGDFDHAVDLDVPFKVVRFALLPKGDLLVLGVDEARSAPILAIVDDNGHLRRYLDSEPTMPTTAMLLSHLSEGNRNIAAEGVPDSARLSFALSGVNFAHHGKDILLLMGGRHPIVIEVTALLTMRSVALHMPEGLTADAVVPASGGDWVMRAHGKDDDVSMLIAFDPGTGKPVREIKTSGVPPSAINCIADGIYTGFRFFPRSNKVTVLEGK